jgi:hypothetical protein
MRGSARAGQLDDITEGHCGRSRGRIETFGWWPLKQGGRGMAFSKRAWIILAIVIVVIALSVLFMTPATVEVTSEGGEITRN